VQDSLNIHHPGHYIVLILYQDFGTLSSDKWLYNIAKIPSCRAVEHTTVTPNRTWQCMRLFQIKVRIQIHLMYMQWLSHGMLSRGMVIPWPQCILWGHQ
jgi:hypothetical protein